MRKFYLISVSILGLFSCKKENGDLNHDIILISNSFTKVFDFNSNLLPTYYKYSQNENNLYSSINYTFLKKSKIPLKIEYKTSGHVNDYKSYTYLYNEEDRVLKEYSSELINIYVLNNNLTVKYILDSNNDTIFHYFYNNSGLLSIIKGKYGTTDSLFYSENKLVKSIYTNENGYFFKIYFYYNYDSVGRLNYEKSNNPQEGSWSEKTYTYNRLGKLTKLNTNILDWNVKQNNSYLPVNMNPINFFLFPYLHLESLD